MTSFVGCLCLILTLSMVGSPQGATIRTGFHSSSWWDSKASSQIWAQARKFETAGDFEAAEKLWEQGSMEAGRIGDITASVRYLTSLGACRVSLFRFRAALDALVQARRLAASIGDREDIGAISVNLSSLYLQMWDLTAALRAVEDGRAATASLPNPYFRPHLLLQLGRLHEILGDDQAVPFLRESIEAARAQDVLAVETTAWDFLGEERLKRGRVAEAETALGEAFRLRLLFDRANLGFSYARLGALKLAQGDLPGAARWTQRALAAGVRIANTFPAYLLAQQQGQIRLARGDAEGALEDFAAALDLSTAWRREVLPAATALVNANAGLEQQIFRSFIELGAKQALRTGRTKWAADTFQALEWNRAASLRESLALADVWRQKLLPEYWELLAKLSAEDARVLRTGGSRSAEAERLQLKLTELESAAGVVDLVKKGENFRSRTSLNHFRKVLRDSEVVLSFHSGEAESYLWAVTRTTLSLYRIAPGKQLRESVEGFREAVRTGKPEAGQLGKELYSALFGQLKPEEAGKSSWLLSLDGPLFELPFAALVTEQKGGKLVYLMEQHSLQVVPGALLLTNVLSNGTGARRSGWFLGVGDPIYNAADPRWREAPSPGLLAGLERIAGSNALTDPGQLNRLVASGDEVQSSAEHWRAGSGTTTLLEGSEARRDRFLGMLRSQPAAVIHLATHVLTPPQRQQQAFLAFGLGPSAQPEFLATSDVAMLHVPGALVVMTGCATAAGDEQAGAGLLGLTRAWQVAGASAVIATAWPVKDSGGEFFASFYQHLQHSPAAEALHLSQLEMVRSNTWRSEANYWASYQVTGGAR